MFKKLVMTSLVAAVSLSTLSIGAAKAEMRDHHMMKKHMMMKRHMMMRKQMMHHRMMRHGM